MKLKLIFPAQSLKIEIPAQEIEVEFSLVPEVPPIEPPIVEPEPPIEPPVIVPEPPIVEPPITIDEVFDFDKFLNSSESVLYLPSEFDGKEVKFRSKGLIKTSDKIILGNSTFLVNENWNEAATQLFDNSQNREIGISGINFVTPPNRPLVTGFPDKEVFGWNRDTLQSGKLAYINVPEMKDKERVTYGLCRFGYSSASNENIYLIGKNIVHNGFNFTQLKNPYEGNVFLYLENVKIHNPIIEGPQSHYYTPTRVKVRIQVQDGVAKIISDNTFDQILTWAGYNNGNQRSIIHFDRYVFDISDFKLIDNKTLKLAYPDEYHPLDNIAGLGKVLTKQIDGSRKSNWVYTYEQNNLGTQITLPEGEFDAFIVYKGNALFQVPISKDTKFGDGYWESGVITQSQGYGWSWYNEEFSGLIKNFHGLGYFRNSGGSGKTKGLTIIDSTFEKNPPIATANNPTPPKEVTDFIAKIESYLPTR